MRRSHPCPGQYHYSPDQLGRMVERAHAHGVSRVILFGLPAHKDERGSSAWDENGVVQQGIRKIKALAPEMYIVTDVCMCEYTSHGHCGILCGHDVDNDKTLEVLAKTAVSHVRAGADMVAPSDMMDGRVAAIRRALDENGFIHVPIMSYAAKYASSFYGPFREAAGSAPCVRRPALLPDGPAQRPRGHARMRARCGRGRGYPDDQARHALSRPDVPVQAAVPTCRLRRIRCPANTR